MISLCIISRKEDELALKSAIASAQQFVDEVIVVDTTPDGEIFKGDLEEHVKSVPFKWTNDFSAARNFSFEQATGDVILWLDSDDILVNPEKLPELAKRITDGETDWIELEYIYSKDDQGRVTMRHWKPRLTRKGTGKWVGRIHETYQAEQGIVVERSEEVKVDHQITPEHSVASAKRNLEILLEEFEKDGDDTDPRTLYYLGMTLMEIKEFDKAAYFFSRHIPRCGWVEEKYFSMHYLSHCLSYDGKYDEAIRVALEATTVAPQWSLAYFDLAEFYSLKGEYWKVIEWTLTGQSKDTPDPKSYFINDLDYTVMPMGRLADAYLQVHMFEDAAQIATALKKRWPEDPLIQELYDTCIKIMQDEEFVNSFVKVADTIRRKDRVKAVRLFDILPSDLDADIRIQHLRKLIVPPKSWGDKSIAIYCGEGNGENWAYPSVFTGIGGSEEAVINISKELVALGYEVTVYNNCGSQRGIYEGVEYVPYYHINTNDSFNILISWRMPALFHDEIKAKKKIVWLHDIAYPQQFSEKGIENADTFVFLSKWHRDNMPSIPDEKVFISNNGIDPKHFENIPEKEERIFWGSSYDRGLVCLLKDIMPKVNEKLGREIPVDVCYGLDNLRKEAEFSPHYKAVLEEVTPLLELPFVTHHGRVSHQKVAELMKRAKVMAYPSEFGETNMITSQKAQAAGTYVVITKQAGGAPEYIVFGDIIDAPEIYSNQESQDKYVSALVKALETEHKPKESVSERFSWKTTAESWKKGLL